MNKRKRKKSHTESMKKFYYAKDFFIKNEVFFKNNDNVFFYYVSNNINHINNEKKRNILNKLRSAFKSGYDYIEPLWAFYDMYDKEISVEIYADGEVYINDQLQVNVFQCSLDNEIASIYELARSVKLRINKKDNQFNSIVNLSML